MLGEDWGEAGASGADANKGARDAPLWDFTRVSGATASRLSFGEPSHAEAGGQASNCIARTAPMRHALAHLNVTGEPGRVALAPCPLCPGSWGEGPGSDRALRALLATLQSSGHELPTAGCWCSQCRAVWHGPVDEDLGSYEAPQHPAAPQPHAVLDTGSASSGRRIRSSRPGWPAEWRCTHVDRSGELPTECPGSVRMDEIPPPSGVRPPSPTACCRAPSGWRAAGSAARGQWVAQWCCTAFGRPRPEDPAFARSWGPQPRRPMTGTPHSTVLLDAAGFLSAFDAAAWRSHTAASGWCDMVVHKLRQADPVLTVGLVDAFAVVAPIAADAAAAQARPKLSA